jgi:hypothetical protein
MLGIDVGTHEWLWNKDLVCFSSNCLRGQAVQPDWINKVRRYDALYQHSTLNGSLSRSPMTT